MASVDRNARCPCGSGRKYKKCCAWKDAAAAAAAKRNSMPVRDATAWKTAEGQWIAEIKPDVEDAIDGLLQRLERGEGRAVKAQIAALYNKLPGYHMTNYAMGVCSGLIDDDATAAIRFFREAVRILPVFAEAHYNLGCACFKSCRVGEAVAAFRETIRCSSGIDGLDKMAQEKIDQLERIVTRTSPLRTIDAYVENEQSFDVAFSHLRNQQWATAAEMFGKVLKQNPRHVQSYGNLGLSYAGLGRKADALAALDRALELDPSYEIARQNRQILEEMTEGKPFVPRQFAETEYYRERLRNSTAC